MAICRQVLYKYIYPLYVTNARTLDARWQCDKRALARAVWGGIVTAILNQVHITALCQHTHTTQTYIRIDTFA